MHQKVALVRRVRYQFVMHELHSALSLARALLSLCRARKTGVLSVCSRTDVCRIAVVDGVLRAAGSAGDVEPLGDVLLRGGDLDTPAHLRALEQGAPEHPVGEWLVRAGIASRPAVENALRDQLRARVLAVFAWKEQNYQFVEGRAEMGIPWVHEPVATADIVLAALRRQTGAAAVARLINEHGTTSLTLSALGRSLVRDAALWPDEAAMLPLLDRGAQLSALCSVTAGSPRALRTLAALVALAAVVPSHARGSRYSVLVRKQRQVRKRVSAAELLDLPDDVVPGDARRALRRLVQTVHPDTFGLQAPLAVRRASTELMCALLRAEGELRAQAVGARRERSSQ